MTSKPNELLLGKKHLLKVLYKDCSFCPDPLTNMVAHMQFLFLVGRFLKHLKPFDQIKQHFTGSIFGRSSRFLHFVPIEQILSETRRHNEYLLCRNDVWEILYKISILAYYVPSYNLHGCHRQFLFVIGHLKTSSLKPFGQIIWNWVGNTYGRFCVKFPQNKMTGERHRLMDWASSFFFTEFLSQISFKTKMHSVIM